jgi:hypothetical protein
VALIWSWIGITGAYAADQVAPTLKYENYTPPPGVPTWSIVGTVSPTWTDNAFFSRDNRKRDWYFEPDVTIRLDGRLTEDVAYRLYTRTEFAAFAREKDANASFALLGGRLTRNVLGWNASATYENRYQYAGVYNEQLFVAHDFMGAFSRDFFVGNLIFTPFVQGRYRTADLAETWRYRLDLVLGIEAIINERWSVVSTPFFEAYWFESGLNAGRADQIYSVSLGLKYNITRNTALTLYGSYEDRRSNDALRTYRSFDVGPKFSFAF